MIIRKARAKDVPAIARVHVGVWQSAYAGIVDSDFLDSLSYEERERMWVNVFSASARKVCLLVAETADGTLAGFAARGPERSGDEIYPGEIYAIYLLEKCQRQGLGTMLLKALVKELAHKSLTPFLVWVLRANSACRFYEGLGGKYVREQEIEIGKRRLVEVAYGW